MPGAYLIVQSDKPDQNKDDQLMWILTDASGVEMCRSSVTFDTEKQVRTHISRVKTISGKFAKVMVKP